MAVLDKNFLDGAKTKEEWTAKRPKLKEQFFDMLGLAPRPEKSDLHATVAGTLDLDDVSVEKIHFQSRPGLYVTGNLYRPRLAVKDREAARDPLPLRTLQRGAATGTSRRTRGTACGSPATGYVCFVLRHAPARRGRGKHHGTYNLDRFWWH